MYQGAPLRANEIQISTMGTTTEHTSCDFQKLINVQISVSD